MPDYLKNTILFCCTLLISSTVFSASSNENLAPFNDDCSKAYLIRNVQNWCSSPAQFTNVGATRSLYERADCFLGLDDDKDVWFKFISVGNIVNITVIGDVSRGSKGTLNQPQFALYQGSCGNFREVACHSDARGYNISETFAYNMVIGATYYIRVDGRNYQTGSFQLCVNNYNEVPSPSSDCSTGVILCDKSSFTVPSIVGHGAVRENVSYTCLNDEESSAWYKFTCDKPGSLTFTLTPLNPGDDIDFALFVLPNGLDDCSLKIPVRCMASGENPGTNWERCSGATGMKMGLSDIEEMPGCDRFDDNFIAGITMTEGTSYALLIQNFHNTGNGFSIEFGGTGTFVGPQAWYKVSKLKITQDQELWVRDVSTFPGGIAKWEWNFGLDAKPQSSKRRGPHKVNYNSPGKKSIRLTVETENGCLVSAVRTITVNEAPKEPPPPPEPELTEPSVAEDNNEKVEEKPNIEPPNVEESLASTEPIISNSEKQDTLPKLSNVPIEESSSSDEDTSTENSSDLGSTPEERIKTRILRTRWMVKRVGILYYPSDSFNIFEEHHEVLQEMVDLLKSDLSAIAYVEGHTNGIPHDNYCNELATKRATSAIRYLIKKGIAEDRLTDKIFGKTKPKETNKSLYGRKKNQRVEIKIMYPDE